MLDEDAIKALLGRGAAADEALRDPGVAKAIRGTSPLALHAALRRFLGRTRSQTTREALDAALARRRAFAEPIRKAPSMTTINGVGTRLYGSDDLDPSDGSHIATLYFTFLFVPVVPLASYVVSDAPPQSGLLGKKAAWYFQSKVPLSRTHRTWAKAVAALAAIIGLCVVLALWSASTHSDVHFLNGLDVPVEVTMGDHHATLAPQARSHCEFAAGRHHVKAVVAGRTIEEIDVDLPGGMNCATYNVLGAAPVYEEQVVYTSSKSDAKEPPPPALLGGSSWIVCKGVDYPFTQAPATVQMSKHVTREVRRRVAVSDGGWMTTVSALANTKETQRAAEVARRVALAEPEDPDAVRFALYASEAQGDAAPHLDFTHKLVAAAPGSIDAHRGYQAAMQDAGRGQDVLAEYRARFEKEPDSAVAGYLYARLAPHADSMQVYERLVPRHPADVPLRRGHAWVLFHERRFVEFLAQVKEYESLAPAEARGMLRYHALALVALGRVPEAQKLVRAAIGEETWPVLTLYAHLERMPGADASMPTSLSLVPSVTGSSDPPTDSLRAEQASWLRDAAEFEKRKAAIEDESRRRSAELRVLAVHDVERGARESASAPNLVLGMLDDETCVALACELDRTGQADAARRLYGVVTRELRRELPFEAIHALPSLEGLSDSLELDLRAILAVAASRRVTDRAKKAELLDVARRDDLLQWVVPR